MWFDISSTPALSLLGPVLVAFIVFFCSFLPFFGAFRDFLRKLQICNVELKPSPDLGIHVQITIADLKVRAVFRVLCRFRVRNVHLSYSIICIAQEKLLLKAAGKFGKGGGSGDGGGGDDVEGFLFPPFCRNSLWMSACESSRRSRGTAISSSFQDVHLNISRTHPFENAKVFWWKATVERQFFLHPLLCCLMQNIVPWRCLYRPRTLRRRLSWMRGALHLDWSVCFLSKMGK